MLPASLTLAEKSVQGQRCYIEADRLGVALLVAYDARLVCEISGLNCHIVDHEQMSDAVGKLHWCTPKHINGGMPLLCKANSADEG